MVGRGASVGAGATGPRGLTRAQYQHALHGESQRGCRGRILRQWIPPVQLFETGPMDFRHGRPSAMAADPSSAPGGGPPGLTESKYCQYGG